MLKAADDIAISEFAPAKINLYLHVLGKRSDGYHLLDSLIAFADIGDGIRVEPALGLALRLEGAFAKELPPGQNNLVLRAAHALRALLKTDEGADITLTKNLPLASGIGGGSADAAAAIRALVKLWSAEKRIPREELARLALGLGADIPVCLLGRTSYFGGIGEIINQAPPLPDIHLLLANPLMETPTPEIFKKRKGAFSSTMRLASWPENPKDLARALAKRHNDLEAPAMEIVPAIGELLDLIRATPHCLLARMSGSGATCFGLYERREEAAMAAEILKKAQPAWWIKSGRLLP